VYEKKGREVICSVGHYGEYEGVRKCRPPSQRNIEKKKLKGAKARLETPRKYYGTLNSDVWGYRSKKKLTASEEGTGEMNNGLFEP